jgi:hypothetical protein
VATGTPEEISGMEDSHTAEYLGRVLEQPVAGAASRD